MKVKKKKEKKRTEQMRKEKIIEKGKKIKREG